MPVTLQLSTQPAECRHGFCAEYLIEQGADPFVQDRSHNRSAIHYAAAKGKSGSLKRLLSEHMCIHTDEGFVPLKDARIQDVSGNCRYACPTIGLHLSAPLVVYTCQRCTNLSSHVPSEILSQVCSRHVKVYYHAGAHSESLHIVEHVIPISPVF